MSSWCVLFVFNLIRFDPKPTVFDCVSGEPKYFIILKLTMNLSAYKFKKKRKSSKKSFNGHLRDGKNCE